MLTLHTSILDQAVFLLRYVRYCLNAEQTTAATGCSAPAELCELTTSSSAVISHCSDQCICSGGFCKRLERNCSADPWQCFRYKTALEACLAHDQAIRMLTGFRDIRTNYEEPEHTFYDPSVDAKMRALLASMDLAPAPASSMLRAAAKTSPPSRTGPQCSSSAPPSVAADVTDCLTSTDSRRPDSDHASYSQDDVGSAHSTSAVASPNAAAPAAAPPNTVPAAEAVSRLGLPNTSAAATAAQPQPCTSGLLRKVQVVNMQSIDFHTLVVFAHPVGASTTPTQATYAEHTPLTPACPSDAGIRAPVPIAEVPCVVDCSSRVYPHHQHQHADYDHVRVYSCSSSHSVCTHRMDCCSDSSAGGVAAAEPRAASDAAVWQYQQQQKHAAAAQQRMMGLPESESLAWSSVHDVDSYRNHQHLQYHVLLQYQQQQHHQSYRHSQQHQQMTGHHMLQQQCEYPAAQHAASRRPYDEVDALLDKLLQMPLDELHALA